ncbi:SDR family oxidoreductase [uncultured Amnibacterium sp.]|uniref:SDR family oxidoreductase n=1 Tax=uncultured Amnibacterium sp. TaxID=1631851 RepID=UPI0035CB9BC9
MTLDGSVAVVTGAATGIGRGIALALAAAGAAVVVDHRSDAEQADAVVRSIRESGGRASAFRADIGVRAEHRALIDFTLDTFGRWDVLVANAAWAPTKPLRDFSEEEIDAVLAVNVKGLIWGLQLADALMSDGGRIVAISSSTTGLQLPGYSVYDSTKGAMDQLVRIFAHEVGDRGIRVNALAPGATATETYAAGRGEELVRRFSAMSAFDRLGSVEEIADVAVFLASAESRWITGQVVRVNGGTV